MKAPERGMLRQSIFATVKSLIVTGQLPPGSRIVEEELAERLGVSRTPVREALNRLERDGLVVVRPRSGFGVAPFDTKSAQDAFDMREALECHAAVLACARIDDGGRRRLRTIIEECEALAALRGRTTHEALIEMQLGVDLHRAIAELGGNILLAETVSRLLDRCQAWVWMDLTRLDHWGEARADHRQIVEAVCAGDSTRAEAEMRAHLRDARDNVLRLLTAREELYTLGHFSTEAGETVS